MSLNHTQLACTAAQRFDFFQAGFKVAQALREPGAGGALQLQSMRLSGVFSWEFYSRKHSKLPWRTQMKGKTNGIWCIVYVFLLSFDLC